MEVFTQTLISGNSRMDINLSAFSSGLYFIQVKLDDEPPLLQRVVINQ